MINKVTLIGNLGNDPEIRTFANGGSVATLSVATKESWKDRASGEWREKTEWHRVSCYVPALNDMLVRAYRKGDMVFIEGKLETRSWTAQDGSTRKMVEVAMRPGSVIRRLSKGSAARADAPAQSSARGSSRAVADAEDFGEIPF